MLRNWRIWPVSSRTWRERSGKRVVKALRASAMVAAVQSTLGAPSVKRRKAVGISMVTGIFASLLLGGRVGSELVIEVGLEGVEAWGDGFRYRKIGSDGVGGFQSVASDGDHRRFLRLNAAFADE